jgi:hypothetical protein
MRAAASPFENLHPYFIQCMTGRGDTLQAQDGTIYRPAQNDAAPHFTSSEPSRGALPGSIPPSPGGIEPPQPEDPFAADEYVLQGRHYGDPERKMTDRLSGMDWLGKADEMWADAVKYCNLPDRQCNPAAATNSSFVASAYTYALDAAIEPNRFEEFRSRIQMACDALRAAKQRHSDTSGYSIAWRLPTGGNGRVCVSPKVLQAAVDEARKEAPAVQQREKADEAEAAKKWAEEAAQESARREAWNRLPRGQRLNQCGSRCDTNMCNFGNDWGKMISGGSPWADVFKTDCPAQFQSCMQDCMSGR